MGDDFFLQLVRKLAEALQAKYALVGELQPGKPERVRTRAVWAGGKPGDNFEYLLADTPCAEVMGRQICWHVDGVQQSFPRDRLLADMGVTAYAGVPLFDARGQALGLIAVLHDQPLPDLPDLRALLKFCAARAGAELERSRLEALREESERFARRIVQTTPLITYVYDLSRRQVDFFNQQLTESLGYGERDVRAWGPEFLAAIMHADDQPWIGTDPARWVAVTDQDIITTEFRLRGMDGNWRWFIGTDAVFHRSPEGKVQQILGTARDITALKEAQFALGRREREYRALAENIPDNVARFDGELRYVYVNPAVVRATGIPRERFIGHTSEEVGFPPALAQVWESALRKVFTTGQSFTIQFNYEGVRGPRHFESILTPEPGPTRLVETVLVVSRDVTVRQEAAIELGRIRARQASAQHHARLGYWDLVPGAERPTWSEEMYWLLGEKPGSAPLTTEEFFARLHPEDREAAREAQARSRDSTDPVGLIFRTDPARGPVRFLHATFFAVRDEQGRLVQHSGTLQDISERKRMEEALRMSEERLRACIEHTPHVAVQWYDEHGKVLFWNRASEEVFGWKAAEMVGRTLEHIRFGAEGTREFLATLQKIKATGEPVGPIEGEVRRRDGTTGYVVTTFFAIPGDAATPYFVGMDVDITARRQAERELAAREEYYRHLIVESPLAIMVVGAQGRIPHLNPKFTELFGYAPEEVPDLAAWWQLAYPNIEYRERLRGEWEEKLRSARATGRPVAPLEMDVVARDGKTRHVQASASFYADQEILVFHDLTERVRLENELRQAQKLEIVGHLAGGVAHDFNNVLQAVMGFVGLAQDTSLSLTERDSYLREAVACTKRATQLTRQLLAFGRRQPLNIEEIPVSELVTNLLSLLRRLLGEHIEVSLKAAPNAGSIRGDRIQIEQVLINLCVNARDAMPNGGKIQIKVDKIEFKNSYREAHPWAKPGRYVEISVADTGCGMDKATLEHVFEPFFTTKPKDKGTGLGLSVVYGIVRQHEGHIRVYSEPKIGTTFRIFLPVSSGGSTPPIAAVAPPPDGGTETILVAEDDETIRVLARRFLERAGYKVLEAHNGEEAVHVWEVHRKQIALVVFDAVMPKLSGLEAYERIRKRAHGPVPAIFASGYNEAFTQGSLELPAGAILLQKPYDPEDLLRRIRQMLGQSSKG